MAVKSHAPLITVLMSVYNGAQYLRESIDSILLQTFYDFEFIVVDDGSTDDSLRILESYSDPRLCIIRQSANRGLVAALNLAAQAATAPLFARMDADDVALPERFQLQVAAFAAMPDLVLLGTAFNIIDGDGRAVGHRSVPTKDAELRSALLDGNTFAHPTVMMRADAFRACGGYRDIGGRYAQDYDLWFRLAEHGQVGNLDSPQLNYRVHEQQVSIDKLLKQREAAELYRQLALHRQKHGVEDIAKAQAIVHSMSRKLRSQCAGELLWHSKTYARDGNKRDANKLRLRALRIAPLSKPIWLEISASVRWKLRYIFSK